MQNAVSEPRVELAVLVHDHLFAQVAWESVVFDTRRGKEGVEAIYHFVTLLVRFALQGPLAYAPVSRKVAHLDCPLCETFPLLGGHYSGNLVCFTAHPLFVYFVVLLFFVFTRRARQATSHIHVMNGIGEGR